MSSTPLWVPLVVALVAVLGTLAGVVFTQVWNSRLDEKRWKRETDRLREAQTRDDLNRTYDHRRAAYVDFLQEHERLQQKWWRGSNEPRVAYNDPIFDGLWDRYAPVKVYGTHMADILALESLRRLMDWATKPEDASRADSCIEASENYLLQVRKDLGVPESKPVEQRGGKG